jgi:hypothetical protein
MTAFNLCKQLYVFSTTFILLNTDKRREQLGQSTKLIYYKQIAASSNSTANILLQRLWARISPAAPYVYKVLDMYSD